MRRNAARVSYNYTIETCPNTLVSRKYLDADRLKISNSALVDWDIFEPLLAYRKNEI